MIDLRDHPEVLEELKLYGIKDEVISKEELDNMIESLDDAIERKKREAATRSHRSIDPLIQGGVKIALVAILGTLQMQTKESTIEKLSFEILLQIAVEMGAFEETFTHIARGAGATRETERIFAKGMTAIALILVAEAVNPQLIWELKEALIDALSYVRNSLEGLDGKGGELALYVQQGLIALEEENLESFSEAYRGALNIVGATPEGIRKDLKKVEQITKTVWEALLKEEELHAATGISQA